MEQKPAKGMATASLILGILSFFLLSIFGAIPAIICGHIAKSRIRQNPEGASCNGRATAGLILGYLHIGLLLFLFVIGIAAAIVVPLLAANPSQKTQPSPVVATSPVTQMAHNRDRAIEAEALATIGAVSTAGRLYSVEKGYPPKQFADLLTVGLLTKEEMHGTYYTSTSGWDSAVFDSNGRVLSVTLTNTRGQTARFVLNPDTRRYEVQ
jgi:hypothetical protein